MTNSSGRRTRPAKRRPYRSRTTPALAAESRARGEIQEGCCPGLMASSASQRRTVAVDTSATRPLASSSSRSSARLQRPSGTPRVAGSSHAIALTSATTTAANTRGRPERGRSRKPGYPWVQNRWRHLRTVLGATPTRRAISALGSPAAASSTILARTTCRCGAACDRAARVGGRRRAARTVAARHTRPWRRGLRPCGPLQRAALACSQADLEPAAPAAACHPGLDLPPPGPARWPAGRNPTWLGEDGGMAATIPESTKISLHQRLLARARERWAGLADVQVRFRGRVAYIAGELEGGEVLALCRLRYVGSATVWGFTIWLASRDGYQDSILPSGRASGAPQGGRDCACGLYLADPSAWSEHRSRRPASSA